MLVALFVLTLCTVKKEWEKDETVLRLLIVWYQYLIDSPRKLWFCQWVLLQFLYVYEGSCTTTQWVCSISFTIAKARQQCITWSDTTQLSKLIPFQSATHLRDLCVTVWVPLSERLPNHPLTPSILSLVAMQLHYTYVRLKLLLNAVVVSVIDGSYHLGFWHSGANSPNHLVHNLVSFRGAEMHVSRNCGDSCLSVFIHVLSLARVVV